MKLPNLNTSDLNHKLKFVRKNWQTLFLVFLILSAALVWTKISAQNAEIKQQTPTIFCIGERLSYNLSFGKFKNAGVAEFYVASRGKLSERDAVELQGRIKTTDFVSAAFYLLDETRTTYAAAETGLPLYIRKTSNAGVLPKETIDNFLLAPTANFDLLTVIYQARYAGGIGNFPLLEDEKSYNIGFQRTVIEKFKNELGEFDTSVSTVQSQYFTDRGISEVRINFTNDEARIPVLFRFKTAKGEFYAEIAAIQMPEPSPTPTPKPIQSQTPFPTPKPSSTPQNYVRQRAAFAGFAVQIGRNFGISRFGKRQKFGHRNASSQRAQKVQKSRQFASDGDRYSSSAEPTDFKFKRFAPNANKSRTRFRHLILTRNLTAYSMSITKPFRLTKSTEKRKSAAQI